MVILRLEDYLTLFLLIFDLMGRFPFLCETCFVEKFVKLIRIKRHMQHYYLMPFALGFDAKSYR
jgi:hypothetical protein